MPLTAKLRRNWGSEMKNFCAAIAVLTAALATPASAREITEPDWTHKPSIEAVQDLFPPIPLALGLRGYAELSCEVAATGVLHDCEVPIERPVGLGLGSAAFSLADRFRMSPRARNGTPVAGGTVRIPIRFELPPPVPRPALPHPTSPQAVAEARRLVNLDGTSASWRDLMAGSLERAIEAPAAKSAIGAAAIAAIRLSHEQSLVEMLEARATVIAATLTTEELQKLVQDAQRPGVEALREQEHLTEAGLEKARRNLISATRIDAKTAICRTRDCTETFANLSLPPVWIEQPSAAERARLSPKVAGILGISGHADLACEVTPHGTLQGCRLTAESPGGFNFGKAALALAAQFRAAPSATPSKQKLLELTVVFPAEDVSVRQPDARPADARLELARKVAARGGFDVQVRMSLSELVHAFQHTADGVDDAKLVEELISALGAGIDRAMPALIEEQARVYADLFTTAQLSDIETYFANPARTKLALADAAQMDFWRDFVTALQADVVARNEREFCKSHDCSVPRATPKPRGS